MDRMNAERSTTRNAFQTLAFLEEAIYFSHLAQCSFRPPLLLNNCFNLLTERLNILRIRCEVKECMGEALSCGVNHTSQGWNIIRSVLGKTSNRKI